MTLKLWASFALLREKHHLGRKFMYLLRGYFYYEAGWPFTFVLRGASANSTNTLVRLFVQLGCAYPQLKACMEQCLSTYLERYTALMRRLDKRKAAANSWNILQQSLTLNQARNLLPGALLRTYLRPSFLHQLPFFRRLGSCCFN